MNYKKLDLIELKLLNAKRVQVVGLGEPFSVRYGNDDHSPLSAGIAAVEGLGRHVQGYGVVGGNYVLLVKEAVK